MKRKMQCVVLAETPADPYIALMQTYVQSGDMPLWMRFREASGTTVANGGYLQAAGAGVWAPGAGALGQAGVNNRPGEAYLFDGADSKIAIAANGPLKTAEWTIGCLVYPTSAGESNIGQFFGYSDAADTAGRFDGANTKLIFSIGGTGQGITRGGTTGIRPTLNAWQWFFFTLTDADKKGRIYKGYQGAITEFTYSTQTAWSGTQNPTAILTLGNDASKARSFAGSMDEYFHSNHLWTADEMLAVVQKRGV